MGDLATDTTIEGADGRYRASLSRDWEIWGPNGGYLAALALRAASAATPLPRPASFACHYLAVAAFEPVDLLVTPLRAARRAASVRVEMTQRGQRILEALAWFVADGLDGLAHEAVRMPDVPPPAALPSIEELLPPEDRAPFPFWNNFDRKPCGWVPRDELRPREPTARGWYRYRPRAAFDDPVLEAARAVVLLDTLLWPAAWIAHLPPDDYTAPSLDVVAQFHRPAPESDWLFVDAISPVATDGLIGGRAAVWSTDGRLLASGAGQLLCRPPRGG